MLDASDPRYRPEPRVVRLPAWRRAGGDGFEVLSERTGEWRASHPMLVASLEALRDGGTFEDAVQRALLRSGDVKESHVRIILRRHLWQLALDGHIEIPLPPFPDVFADRYRRLKELGRGGVGVAHLCRDQTTGAEVVVKHAWGWLAPIDKADRAMREEDAALRAFDHPGIPRHLDAFEREGLLHVVRGFVDGEPLGARVAREGPPSADERRRIVRAAADIVHHMHERSYLFLDPAPNNFVLRADGAVLVIDVGICRRHEGGRALKHGQAGSRGYAAYEVVARENVGVWSDAFGIGSLHYHLAAGKAPGHAWTDEERAERVAKLDVEDDERRLMLAAWARDPAARPTLEAMLRALA